MNDKLIFHIGHSAGFYSEFNNMVLAILYCQRHNIQFELYSKDANFAIKDGWSDYFLPFCKEHKGLVHHFINQRFDAPKGGKRKLLYDGYKRLFPQNYLTCDLWYQFRHIDHTELTTEETASLSEEIIDAIYKFNPQIQSRIDELMSTVDFESPYVGFHLRGGDKVTEHALMDITTYISKAKSVTNIRRGFIYTDDYSLFETAQNNFPDWSFSTLAKESDRGYYHLEFLKLTKEQKQVKLINMFASMELLSRACYSICTYSSNPGMFLGMRMGKRAIGIDYNNWLIW